MSLWEDFGRLFDSRQEPPLRPVPGLGMSAPPRDDDFVASLEPIGDAEVEGVAVGISYRDASGRPSQRTIRCDAAYRDGNLVYLQAWCLHRQDWRTFRLDRIQEVYDYTTGEIIGSGASFFAPLVKIDLPLAVREAKRSFRDGAKVLLFIAMEDGHLHDNELKVVMDYAHDRMRAISPELHQGENIARQWIGNYVPSRQSALAGLRTLLVDESHAREVADRMIEVMLADGTVTDEEMDAAWAIVRGMERAAERAKRRSK